MTVTAGQDAAPIAPGCRCVLLHAPDREPDAALVEALRSRGVEPERVTNAYAALAAVCLPNIARGPVVLLLDEPERVPGRARLVAAARRYAPKAVCWTFEARANPTLRPLVEHPGSVAPASPGAPAPAPIPEPAAPPPPELRLAEAHGLDPRQLTGPAKLPTVDTGRLLTADEVEALMGLGPNKNGRGR